MKERPIIFNDAMVRAILDGRKTQTRRAVSFGDEIMRLGTAMEWAKRMANSGQFGRVASEQIEQKAAQLTGKIHPYIRKDGSLVSRPCPYGQPGDRLWVRECFVDEMGGARKKLGDHLYYRSDHHHPVITDGGWTPSIHMPRWASRITLEITAVRVERLQDISDADCEREGVRPSVDGNASDWLPDETGWLRTYRQLWQSIYGAESWQSNPWVWVVAFRRLP